MYYLGVRVLLIEPIVELKENNARQLNAYGCSFNRTNSGIESSSVKYHPQTLIAFNRTNSGIERNNAPALSITPISFNRTNSGIERN